MYERYKDKGFEIYSVSMDTDRHAWTRSIEADGISWIEVSDLLGWESPVRNAYKVNQVPANFLLGPDRRIIACNLNADELENKLSELLSFN